MPISSRNLRFYLSGGAENTNPNASLGGPRSQTLVSSKLNGLFDDVTGDEAATGETEYRCVYFVNEDIDIDGLLDPIVWIAQQTPSSRTRIEIGLDRQNKVTPALENAHSTPDDIEFSDPAAKKVGRALGGTYHTGDFVALWVRRTVLPGAPAGEEQAILRIAGDTY